jgi:hypothetical protein
MPGRILHTQKCRQHWATGGDVGLHEGLECLNDAMNCVCSGSSPRRSASSLYGGVPGLGLIYEGVAKTFFQHATPIVLLEPRQLFDQRLHNICWSISSTECSEIPSCLNPGISGEDTLSTCISST